MQIRSSVPHLVLLICLILAPAVHCQAEPSLPEEQPLYDNAFENRINYPDGEQVRHASVRAGAPSNSNRVFSHVSAPTYAIHRPEENEGNGIGLVICPGGGYRDVWLDREGHDLAIWLTKHGITSLVLKYRTNSGHDGQPRKYSWDEYLSEVKTDAFAAVRLLRSKSKQLDLDPQKIGICGFSAGGNLAMHAALSLDTDQSNYAVSGRPDFAGLFYPWFRTNAYKALVPSQGVCGPIFIMNALDDRVTPVERCLDFYRVLLDASEPAELHIISKGGHGFDLGDGRGESAALWKHSFVAWLKDGRLPTRTAWMPKAPSSVDVREHKSDILADKSIQLDPKNIGYDTTFRFTFDKPTTVQHVRMELLPSRATPNIPLDKSKPLKPVMLFNLKPLRRTADGRYEYIEFKQCIHPLNLDANTDAVRDYIESAWVVPDPLPGNDSVELLLEFADTLELGPEHELLFELEAGLRGNDGARRVRFSFSDGGQVPW